MTTIMRTTAAREPRAPKTPPIISTNVELSPPALAENFRTVTHEDQILVVSRLYQVYTLPCVCFLSIIVHARLIHDG